MCVPFRSEAKAVIDDEGVSSWLRLGSESLTEHLDLLLVCATVVSLAGGERLVKLTSPMT